MIREKILQLNINKEKVAFWTLIGILFLCIGFYMYSINMTVRNVVAREKIEARISELALSTSNSEFQYINKRNGITLSTAHVLGFQDVAEKKFVSKNSVSLVSYRNE